jgi:hypothetical protein
MTKLLSILWILLLAAGPAMGQAPTVLRLSFIGDIMAHEVNYLSEDFHDIYRGVEDLLTADDLTFANLELPIDERKPIAGYPKFNGSRAYLRAAVDEGVEVFSLANNHAFDQGAEGISQTLMSVAAVRKSSGRPVWASGIRENPAIPFSAMEIRVKGLRVGYLAATQFMNEAGPCPSVNVVDYLDPPAADRFVSLVREESRRFDVFIVSYHCGAEYASKPSPSLLAFFDRLLANGAHVVHGHHPHVFEGWRLVKVKGELRVSLPSMGNFISGMTWGMSPFPPRPFFAATGDSAIVRVTLLCVGGSVCVIGSDAVPIADYRNAGGEMVVGRLDELASGKTPLSAGWTAYYRERLREVAGRLEPAREIISPWPP